MVALERSLSSASYYCSSKYERRPSNASSAPSPKGSASVRSKEHPGDTPREALKKKKLVSVATICGGESACSRFEPGLLQLRLTPCHMASQRRSQPDISPNATLNPKGATPLSVAAGHPDIFVTSGAYDLPSLGRRLSRVKAGVTPSLAFHHSSPHIPLSRTPSPSHSTHSMDAPPPPPSPSPFDLCPYSSSNQPAPLLPPHQHHKRQRSHSNSGSANEKLL